MTSSPPRRRRVTVLGGSSAFTPMLVDALAAAAEELPPLQVILVGRDAQHTDAVARFVELRCNSREIPPDHRFEATTDAATAIRTADLVVNQIRVGGFDGRAFDETFPLAGGVPGDETIGPGGLASALRSVPVFDELVRHLPSGVPWIHMSNPLGIGVRALLEPPHGELAAAQVFGLCELPQRTLRRACRHAGVDIEAVTGQYVGANHQGAFVAVHDQEGRDLLPHILAALERQEAGGGRAEFGVDAKRLRELGVLALSYRRLYEHRTRLVAAQRERQISRALELKSLADQLFAHYAATSSPELPEPLRRRPMPWNELALVPAIACLLDGRPRCLAVSRRNQGHLPGLPESAIVEHFGVQHPTAPRPLPTPRFDTASPQVARELELTRRIDRFEELALCAAREPSDANLVECLASHPFDLDRQACRELTTRIQGSMTRGSPR